MIKLLGLTFALISLCCVSFSQAAGEKEYECTEYAVSEQIQQMVPIFRQGNSPSCFAAAASTALDMWRISVYAQNRHQQALFPSSSFRDFNYIPSSPYLNAIRYWSRNGLDNNLRGGQTRFVLQTATNEGTLLTPIPLTGETFSLESEIIFLASRMSALWPMPRISPEERQSQMRELLITGNYNYFQRVFFPLYLQNENFYSTFDSPKPKLHRIPDQIVTKAKLYDLFSSRLQRHPWQQPVIASLCAQVLENPDYTPPNIDGSIAFKEGTRPNGCSGHAVVIVGRKFENGRCMYKIRDSGIGAVVYLPEDALLRNTFDLLTLSLADIN